MSAKHYIPLRKELHALALVDAKQPLRLVSKIIGVPKSTIHDNLDNYRSNIKAFERQQLRLDRDLVRDILIISMEGKTSSRDCANILSKQRGFYSDSERKSQNSYLFIWQKKFHCFTKSL